MFKLENFMGRRVVTSSFLDEENVVTPKVTAPKVKAFFTTRDLPLKAGEREDLIEEVENNKKLVCDGFNIPYQNLVIPAQTHSDNVEIIDSKKSIYNDCDGLITNQRGIALALNFADCVPIIFYDPIKKVIAVAHAGWRGTVAKIGPKTVDKMVKNFSSKPKDIIALIGPAIGKCCFEVKEDILAQIVNSYRVAINLSPHPNPPPQGREGIARKTKSGLECNLIPINGQAGEAISGMHADLKLINKIQLLASGLKKIDLCEYCTSCQSELFFSYRKENAKTARHSAVIILK